MKWRKRNSVRRCSNDHGKGNNSDQPDHFLFSVLHSFILRTSIFITIGLRYVKKRLWVKIRTHRQSTGSDRLGRNRIFAGGGDQADTGTARAGDARR
jgi:hypothetical protein